MTNQGTSTGIEAAMLLTRILCQPSIVGMQLVWAIFTQKMGSFCQPVAILLPERRLSRRFGKELWTWELRLQGSILLRPRSTEIPPLILANTHSAGKPEMLWIGASTWSSGSRRVVSGNCTVIYGTAACLLKVISIKINQQANGNFFVPLAC